MAGSHAVPFRARNHHSKWWHPVGLSTPTGEGSRCALEAPEEAAAAATAETPPSTRGSRRSGDRLNDASRRSGDRSNTRFVAQLPARRRDVAAAAGADVDIHMLRAQDFLERVHIA